MFIPVILCGGSGSRLFPLSRNNYPKQFIKISNNYSLIQNTILRFNSNDEIILVSNISHKYILTSQIKELYQIGLLNPMIKITIYLEPIGKNTLPAISLVSNDYPNNKLLFIPCDHIYNTEKLLQTINIGLMSNNNIITFGIKPTYPETGFGYIETNKNNNWVNKFIEKPNKEKAEQLILSKNIFWNSGIFLLETTNFNKIVFELQPDIIKILTKLNNTTESESNTNINYIIIDKQYSECDSISIDYGIMELLGSNSIYMVEYNDLWNDIGSFKSIHDILEKDSNGINTDSNVLNLNSSNCLIKNSNTNPDKLVLLNGVSNLSIIDTTDTLLISNNNDSQQVKILYQMATQLNKKEIIYNNFDYRPWGYYEVLAGGDNMGFKIKKIIVNPGKRLSLQSHNKRKEYWFVIKGLGQAQIESKIVNIDTTNNSMVFIDIEQKHRLINNSDSDLEIIEIQLGIYLGEDDIKRFEDDYNRN